MFGKKEKTGQEKKKRILIHEATLENDIRYRGPLSFQHFQILGWLCIALSQVGVILALGGRIDSKLAADTAAGQRLLGEVANLSLPFLLIANFAQILDAEGGYRKQLLKNAAAMLAICALFYAVFYRYIVGGVAVFLEDPREALPAVMSVILVTTPGGFLAYNIFVDLFLCTLTMVFLNYTPRRVFTGRYRLIFRLMALLPIGYEVGCMLLKVRSARGLIEIPVWAYPLLTVKPPMTFVLFVALALFVKTRELRFRRHGRTHEEYKAFLKTNRNSRGFSVFLAVMLVIVSIADLAVVLGFSLDEALHTALEANRQASQSEAVATDEAAPGEIASELASPDEPAPELASPDEPAPELTTPDETAPVALISEEPAPDAITSEEPAPDEALADEALADEALDDEALDDAAQSDELTAAAERGMQVGLAVGFGNSMYLAFLAPVVLLFSYTRKPKYPWLGLLFPAAAVCLILLIYVEGIHELLYCLPIQKVNLEELAQTVLSYAEMLQ